MAIYTSTHTGLEIDNAIDTVDDLVGQVQIVIAAAGYQIVGDFADVTKVEITLENQVYSSKSILGYESALWRPIVALPYTPTGTDPTTGGDEAGNWVAVSVGELETIARSLNTNNNNVMYDTDEVTPIVQYIYSKSQQVTYSAPSAAIGKIISSIVGSTLNTTEPASYVLSQATTDKSGRVNVVLWGAFGKGIVNEYQPLQNSLNYAQDNGLVWYLPKGDYYYPDTNGLLAAANKSLFVAGDGIDVSRLMFDNFSEVAGSGEQALYTGASADGSGTCVLKDFSVVGKWGDEADFSEQQGLVRLNGYDHFYAESIGIKGSRSGGLVSSSTQNAVVTRSRFENCYRDSCRFENAKFADISHNYFKNIQDDSVALPTSDTSGSPVDNTFTISHNTIIDSQGVIALGAKTITISHNKIIRPMHRAIKVGQSQSFSEGRTSGLSITIDNNIIRDGFGGDTFSPLSGGGFDAIEIACKQLLAKDTVGTGSPVVKPYPYLYLNNTDDVAVVNAGLYNIKVHGNNISRTLDATANYSGYGFGTRLSRSGYVDPAIALDDLCEYGIHVSGGGGNGLDITGNTIDGFKQCIKLALFSRTVGVSLQNYSITKNILKNWREAGVFANYNGLLEVKGNIFDGDAYNESIHRAADGGWAATWNQHRGLIIENPPADAATLIESNTFKNCGTPFWQGGAVLTSAQMKSNSLVCQPSVTGYSASNKGIGYIYQPVLLDAGLVVEGSDPQLSDYRKILSLTATSSTSLPTAGYYMVGMYVKDASGSARRGWKRITNGSGHVLNTDWFEDNF